MPRGYANTRTVLRGVGLPSVAGGGGGATAPLSTNYNLNPAPRSGKGPYGLVPGSQGLPDPFPDLAKRFPGLEQSNAQLAQNIMSELSGELPPDVIAAIEDEAARFGITSGMPGSDLARRRGARNLGLSTLDLTRAGLQDYLNATAGISRTQTVDPALKAQIAAHNALLNAAPDPAAAAAAMEASFRRGLDIPGVRGGGGGISSFNPGMPNLSAPRGSPAGMGVPGQTPIYTGPISGTRAPDTGSLGFGAGAPFGSTPGVNPYTGMPIAQLPSNDIFSSDFGGGGSPIQYYGTGEPWAGSTDMQDLFDPNWDDPFANLYQGTGEYGYDAGQSSLAGFDPNDPFGLGDFDWSLLEPFDPNWDY
ncbi:MAG TPA: hypothetical protein VFU31_21090 [Candidatus Binatia bacterium]|nr:hypothetical protein [Candidatus Binatia bacterium]